MTDLKQRLRSTAGAFGAPGIELDHLMDRAVRADRRRRATAGVTAFVIVAAAGSLVFRGFGTDGRPPLQGVGSVENGPIAFLEGELSGSAEGYEIGIVDPATGTTSTVSGMLGPGRAWSHDGSRIAYVHDPSDTPPGDMSIWIAGADGSDPTRLTPGLGDHHPQWSPDDTRILFFRNGDGRYPRLMVMDADGTDAHPIGGENAHQVVFEAAWSPDGSRILTVGDEEPRVSGDPLALAVMDSDGSNRTVLVEGFQNEVQWSTDGTEIYFASGGQLHAVDVADGSQRIVVGDLDAQGLSVVRVSPDGRTIAFTRPFDDGHREELWVVGIDGSDPHLVADHLQWREPEPAWAPDGTAIAFVRDGDIWTVDLTSGEETQIMATPGHETVPAWGPA